jgi:hypothetical protein
MRREPCRWIKGRLPLLAGGELLGLERRLVERHLLGCPGCRARLAAHAEALAALRAAGRVEPASPQPGALWPALARQIAETRRAPASTVDYWSGRRRARWIRLGLAASVLALIAAVGAAAWTVGQHSQVVARPPIVVGSDRVIVRTPFVLKRFRRASDTVVRPAVGESEPRRAIIRTSATEVRLTDQAAPETMLAHEPGALPRDLVLPTN